MYDQSLACWRPTTDVVIFTGTAENAKKVRNYFENCTLFIANGAGHNPVIITPTADLEKAADAVLELQLYNQGQDCANPSSILVHSEIHDALIQILLNKLKKVKIGYYHDKSSIIGPISKLSDLEKVQRILIENKKWIHTETPGTIHVATRIVEPTVIVKPLRDGGNYKEQLSPVFFVQKYSEDANLNLYFENPQYWQNAMYVTIYGESNYINNLLDYRTPNGNILHDESTVIRDTHLHAKGIERGVKPYGGYGRGSSWLSINDKIIIKPTLPQRDIFEQVVAPSIELEKIESLPGITPLAINISTIKLMEKIPTNEEQPKSEKIPMLETNNRILNISEQGWTNEVTEKVLEVFPDKEEYTCASGISPSGIVHFGNFRDVMTSFEIFKNLEKQNKNTRLLFSWDDFDRFRKVPANVDPSFSQYIGLPLSAVPDPTGKTESYAKYLEEEFEKSMKDLGIEAEYCYQTQEYKSGRYDDLIIHAMQSRDRIAEILLSFMSDRGKEEKKIDPEKFKNEYYPVSVYSRFTGKDNTKIIDYDGGSKITYLCLDTKQQETIDLRNEHIAKLSWKIDWPMRWKKEGVVFEPGGHDHASPQGSYNTSSVIAREIFGIEPPVFMEYKFIGIRGLKEKMSGSKGNAITPAELLHIYEPDLLKWIYLRKNPHQTFELAFDTEIYRQYDEYDRAVIDFLEKKENSVYARSLAFVDGINQPKFKNPMPFKQAVAYGQILQWNKEKVMEILNKLGLAYDPTSVEERLIKAKSWLEEYNPEEIIKLRDVVNKEYADTISEDAKNFVRKLHSFLLDVDTKTLSIEKLEEVVYHIPRVDTLPPSELKKAQRAFFKDIYNLLISKDTGPRLPTFIWAVDKKRLLNLLDI